MPRAVFVGSFAPAAVDGTMGGQMAACRGLVSSPLARHVEWRLIDSTQRSLPAPGVAIRGWRAALRTAKLVGLLASGGADSLLVFSSWGGAGFWEKGLMCLAARWFGKRVVLSIRSEIRPDGGRWLEGFRRRVLRACDAILCQSGCAESALRAAYPEATPKTQVIPNWIDCEEFRDAGRAPRVPLTFLFAGWLEPHKGIVELLEAARLLAARDLDFRLVVCGGGSQKDAVKHCCRAVEWKGRLEYRGWISGAAKRAVFAEAQIAVLPSYTEGMPNFLLEAMAAGLAVIATPVGGVGSLIEEGWNGLLIEPGDATALAQAMAELALDPQRVQCMGVINREKARREHDVAGLWPRVAQAMGIEVQA